MHETLHVILGGAHELTPQKLLALRQVANVERSLTSSNSSAETGTNNRLTLYSVTLY